MKGAGYGKINDYKLSLSPPNVFISPPILYHICVHWLRSIFCKFYKIETIMAPRNACRKENRNIFFNGIPHSFANVLLVILYNACNASVGRYDRPKALNVV
jgi:hypothetical protein